MHFWGDKFLIWALIIASSAATFSRAHAADPPGDAPSISDCNSWSAKDWDRYIDKALIGKYLLLSGSSLLERSDNLKNLCRKSYETLRIDNCLDRITGYYSQFNISAGNHDFSNLMTNAEYYASEPKDKVALPPEFASAPNGLPKDWEKIAKKNGWTWANFHSNTANESRLVIRIPDGENYKLLVYYSFKCSADPTKYQGVQLQYVDSTRDVAATKNPVDYYRSWDFSGPGKTPHIGFGGGRCIECHLNGPRAVEPKKNPCFPTRTSDGTTLEAFNESLVVKNRSVDLSPFYDVKHFPTHLQVGTKDGCFNCHNGETRNSLATSIDFLGSFEDNSILRKVEIDKTMPPGQMVTDPSGISWRLREEYYVALKNWLTEVKCDQSANANGVNCPQPGPLIESPAILNTASDGLKAATLTKLDSPEDPKPAAHKYFNHYCASCHIGSDSEVDLKINDSTDLSKVKSETGLTLAQAIRSAGMPRRRNNWSQAQKDQWRDDCPKMIQSLGISPTLAPSYCQE